jgi:membrane fusion protein
MPEDSPLFRAAAVAANRPRTMGEIVLVAPLSFAVLSGLAVLAAAGVVAFGVFARYTEHATVAGQLMPDRGLIKIYAPQPGTLVEKRVAEGQAVAAGQVLYVVSGERRSSQAGATYAEVGRQLASRRRSLATQIGKTKRLAALKRQALEDRRTALQAERGRLRAMLEDQTRRVALAAAAAERYERIRAQGFVSEEQLAAKRGDLLDQRSRLQGLERDDAAVARQLGDLAGQLASLPLEYENQAAELERALAAVDEEFTRNEARRRLTVAAPAAGTLAAVVGEVGQTVDTARPLASIVPLAARLQALLYAPSSAIGFIREGDEVLLRYRAYPYQKFGHYRGTIVAVSQTALAPSELTGAPPMKDPGPASGEPLYRLVVELPAQSVAVYGERRPLRSGMVVEADVLLERRRLYEWVLEPFYALRARVAGTAAEVTPGTAG